MFYEPFEATHITLSEVSILVNVNYHKIPIARVCIQKELQLL